LIKKNRSPKFLEEYKMIIRIVFLTIIFGITSNLIAQDADRDIASSKPGYEAETEKFVFYNHYWLNLHHFLYYESVLRSVKDSSEIKNSVLHKLSADERMILEDALRYYKTNFADNDLRRSAYMSGFKDWIVSKDSSGLNIVPDQFLEHARKLEKVSSVYRRYFWDKYSKQNREVLSSRMGLIQNTENDVFHSLAEIANAYWPEDKIRVDLTYFGNSIRNTAYTTIFPTHIVIPSSNNITYKGSWTEILYHEASHQIIRGNTGYIAGTIKDVAKVQQRSLRNLWHAYLFYISGSVSRNAFKNAGIEDYKLYMVREGVFSLYYPTLDEYLLKFMEREITLAEATKSIVNDMYESLNKS
jgi:hypothetical protein